MSKRNKYNILGWPLAVACFGVALILILGGLLLLRNSQSANADTSAADPTETRHFKGLLDVKIPSEIPSEIKSYTGFQLSFNKGNHTPNWVAWELLGTETEGETSRTNNFWKDQELDGCADTQDYKNSGYDRGHLCPAADMKWSPESMNDCFVMGNIAPQAHSLNSGAWNTLEIKCRQWAKRDSALIIVAGPIYEKSDRETIGNLKVRVPSAFFKIIAAPYLDEPRGIAFVYPNMSSPGNMQNYSMTIDEVEELTGYDFLWQLPDEIENEIESKTSFKLWNK